ncbi:MAG: winged helix-turn-helix domain-containing protein, partial [Anaerolineae bacterium]|nr:winged helix-turn-helix domain-containing protein [Anaerolineae bacterium]
MSARTCVEILVVNSDPAIGRELQAHLHRQGHHVLVTAAVSEALPSIEDQSPELMIIEAHQLERDGAALFRLLDRSTDPPLIIPVSSRALSERGAAALPSDLARAQQIAAQVRRLLSQTREDEEGPLEVGDLLIDMAAKRVVFHGQPVLLPPIQFRLLAYLVRNAGRVVGARELLRSVWGYEGNEAEARELVKVHFVLDRHALLDFADPSELTVTVSVKQMKAGV